MYYLRSENIGADQLHGLSAPCFCMRKNKTKIKIKTGPDSLVVRASASGSEGRGFALRPRHTKGVKNGTGNSLADARYKSVVLRRYKNAGRYLLLVMSQ